MKRVSSLKVFFNGKNGKTQIGNLALYQNKFAAFQYTKEWISKGFSISPFSLPLENKVFMPDWSPFYGSFGVFNDSLPDGWGRLLVDRMLLKKRINPDEISNLDRLAIVGSSGMGAISYEPESFLNEKIELPFDFDEISESCSKILNSENEFTDNFDSIFDAGGSSGGARPKIFSNIEGEDWIIKFPSSVDSKEIGLQEYEYSLCAKECGIEMSETRLFPSKNCSGYFGTKRFDRKKTENTNLRFHMISASALLETSHRIPNLDYNSLFQVTNALCKNSEESEKLFKLMCFNVFAHNKDDHSKNFSWLYDEEKFEWKLSPAYDLTFSSSIGGEHATTIDGEGKNPTLKNLLSVAKQNGLSETFAKNTVLNIEEIVQNRLGKYL